MGSSMGSFIAQIIAARHPDLVKALILSDACYPLTGAVDKGMLLLSLPIIGKKWYRSFRKNPEGAWESLFPYYADIHSLSEADKDFLKTRVMDRVFSKTQERGYFSSLRSMIFQYLRRSYYRRIAGWPGKITLIWGEKDTIVPRIHAEDFLKLLEKNPKELTIISGAGHLPHQEKPAETAEAILAFLRSIP
jgi:pimeloyl-ACP methyl ester carboxylesterase